MAKLENWSLVTDGDFYQPPECMVFHLQGEVVGHPGHEDGKKVTTSSIKELNIEGRVASTRNTTYELGTPNPLWVEYLKEVKSDFYEMLRKY